SKAIESRRAHGPAEALTLSGNGRGKQLMDSIRSEMSGFIALEQGTLAQNESAFQSNMRRLFTMIVTASLLALLFALVFAWLVFQQAQQRLQALVHLETKHLLEIQEATNQQLQEANLTLRESEEKLAVTL